jgi:hypothetical protein
MRTIRILRATAVAAAAVAMGILSLWTWETRLSSTGSTNAVLATQVIIRALAVAAAAGGWVVPMVVLSAAGFYPMGLYLLGSPTHLSAVGVADLVYLAAAIGLFATRRRSRVA